MDVGEWIVPSASNVGGESKRFSAAEAALGYLYQIRVALCWTLERLKNHPDFLIGVETIDDVAFLANGEPTELLQTKHHKRGTGSLTDASVDLWKTLRVWFEGIAGGSIPDTAALFLITTAEAPAGSAASYLRIRERDVSGARVRLAAVASSSTNESNAVAYQAFLSAGDVVQENTLERVVVVDASPGINDLDDRLAAEVFWAARREHRVAFLERLEGWWYRRVLVALADADYGGWMGSVELEAKMSDLRDQFKPEALPVDEELLEFSLDEETLKAHEGSLFVKQIELTRAGRQRIAAAIRDYYRAFEQRSRWLRDELVFASDLRQYEKRLMEEWGLTFEGARDELGDEATAEAKEKAGRSVLSWAEQTLIPIRPNTAEPFVGRGSLHMLSDELRVGWHVDFYERLSELLLAEAS